MTREEVYNMIDEKITEVFLAYQEAEGIKSGDIDPLAWLTLYDLQNSVCDLVIAVCEQNR